MSVAAVNGARQDRVNLLQNMKRVIIAVIILAAVGGGVGAWYSQRNRPEVQITRSPISRGDIVDTVGATGTLQAVTTVQVGSQVSGNIQWLGADFNSIVKKGQVIARLDPSLFDAQLQQQRANLTQARANLSKANSDLEQRRVQLTDAQQKYDRALTLSKQQLLAQSELDAAKVAVDSARAAVQSQQATVTQAQAGVTQSEASVNQSQVNRDHTVIVAPIDGIVTQRSVDVGQTVAASMQAPTLFVIAADLTEMQVNANIDEADVGRIRPGQQVSFRVDAYPTDNFVGTVTQVRLQPVVVQNVTTYGTVIAVPNRELKLKPGMTANVKIEIAKRRNVLRVPNAALRFRPTEEIFAALQQTPPPEAAAFGGRGGSGGGFGRGGAGNASPQAPSPAAAAPGAANTNARAPQSADAAQADGQARRGGEGRSGGRGGFGGGGTGGFGGGGGRGGPEFEARMMDRFKTMSREEQQQFIARMKERGGDASAFEAAMQPAGGLKNAAKASQAQSIDALFAPLPVVETRGRVWLIVNDKELKPVAVRLGISDGTFTELLSTELQDGTELATGATGLAASTRQQPAANSGNPLMPGGRGPGRGGPPGGGRGF
jgi:HlyD family secretion protein